MSITTSSLDQPVTRAEVTTDTLVNDIAKTKRMRGEIGEAKDYGECRMEEGHKSAMSEVDSGVL